MFIQNDQIWTINMLRSTQQAKPPLLNLSVYLAEAEKPPFGWQASSKSTWLRSNKLAFSSFEKVKSCPISFPFLHFDVKSILGHLQPPWFPLARCGTKTMTNLSYLVHVLFCGRYFGQICHIMWFPLRIAAEILGRALKQNIGRSWLSWPEILPILPCMVYN